MNFHDFTENMISISLMNNHFVFKATVIGSLFREVPLLTIICLAGCNMPKSQKRNVAMLTEWSPLMTLAVVIMTTCGVVSKENLVNMIFPFKWCYKIYNWFSARFIIYKVFAAQSCCFYLCVFYTAVGRSKFLSNLVFAPQLLLLFINLPGKKNADPWKKYRQYPIQKYIFNVERYG